MLILGKSEDSVSLVSLGESEGSGGSGASSGTDNEETVISLAHPLSNQIGHSQT
jgi:hypothetical protein